MSITSTLIGSMSSINTALNAMGIQDVAEKQEAQKQHTAAMGMSAEAANLHQQKEDTSQLIKQAREMSTEGGTVVPKDVLQAAAMGRVEQNKATDALLNKWYPGMVAQAKRGGLEGMSRLRMDAQHFLKEYDSGAYSGSFEAYHARAVKQRARDDIQHKKEQARKERERNG